MVAVNLIMVKAAHVTRVLVMPYNPIFFNMFGFQYFSPGNKRKEALGPMKCNLGISWYQCL